MRGKTVWYIVNVSLSLLLVVSTITVPPIMAARVPDSSERPTSSSPVLSDEPADIPPGLRVLTSDARGVTLELITPEYTVVQGEDDFGPCAQLVIDGYSGTNASGTPELPVKGTTVGIPAQGEVTLIVLEAETVTVPEKYTLCPIARPIMKMEPPDQLSYQGEERVRDAAVYATAGFTPTEPAALLSTGFIRSQRVAQVQFRPFQYNPATGELRFARRIRIEITFGAVASLIPQITLSASTSATGTVDEGAFEDVLRNTLVNYEDARIWRTTAQRLPSTLMPQATTDDPAYKILVDADGIYQLTYADLLAAGVPVDSLDPRTLQLHNQGSQVAIYVDGEADGEFNTNDYVLFYGQKMTTKYTDVNVYWLTWGEATGLRMTTSDGTPGGATVPAYYRTTQRIEQNKNYQSSYPSGSDNDRWYWAFVIAASKPTVFTGTFTLNNPATVSTNVTVSGILIGYAAIPQHHTLVYLNGNLIDDATWLSEATHYFTSTVPQSYLINGTNLITVSAPLDGEITLDFFFVNHFDITYDKLYKAESDTLFFDGDVLGNWEYHVDAFTASAIDVFDISQPTTPVHIQGADVIPMGSTYQLIFKQTIPAERHYIALTRSQRLSPKAIITDTPSDLLATTNGADYIMIAHPDFIAAIQPLADYYTGQGLRTEVVDVTEIYDTFSYGIFNPEAIRSFLMYAYISWTRPAPTYVLLVGDGNFDFKNYLGRGETVYIPPYLDDVDPWLGETAADNRYVAVSGNDILPDMHLGRFPVKTVAETTAMVNKALGYMQNPPGTEWNRNILFVTDNQDAAGDFYAYSDSVADYFVPPLYSAQKVYYLQTHTTIDSARAAILDAINEGQLMVNYVGHGAVLFWASERLLQISNIATMTNTGKLSFFVPMTCMEGYYIHPSGTTNYSAISEMLVRAPNKGAVASWSPTGLGLASGHDIMNKTLYQAVFFDGIIELGPATTLGKLAIAGQGHDELIDTYTLFGDPALELNVLKADLSITKTVQTTPPNALFPEAITYTLSYTNTGPSTAYNVVITDVLPAGLENPVVVSSGMTITQRVGTSYVWDIADLPMGTGGVITITATVAPTFRGVLDNRAEIVSDVLDRYKDNNTAAVQTPVGVGPLVTITKSGSNVNLTWDAVIGATRYRVYRSTEAYFVPSPSNAIGTVTTLHYTDNNKIGDPNVNYFYFVTALDAQDQESLPSNAIGEFDFALLPGATGSTRYNVIALPLDVTDQLPNAVALANYVGSSVKQVLHWYPDAQAYEFWLPEISFGTNFQMRVGEVYWVQVDNTAPAIISFVGSVPSQGTVRFDLVSYGSSCQFNEISLPLDQTAITSAAQLADAMGEANVEQALFWRSDVNAFEFWLPEIGFGSNFATRVGYPYHVCLKSGAPTIWP
jgi:uncharacterized repeat protein (TIGR01451 family)